MNESGLGVASAFLSSVTWALGSSTYAKLTQEYSPFAINFSRACVGLPLFFFAALLMNGTSGFQALSWENIGWLGLGVVSSYGLGDAIFFTSTRSLGVSGALAIASIYPLWSALVGVFFQHESLSLTQTLGVLAIVFGTVGVIVNTSAPPESRQSRSEDRFSKKGIGVLLALLTSFAWSFNTWAVAKGGAGVSPLVGNTVRMIWPLLMTPVFSKLFLGHSRMLLPRVAFREKGWVFAVECFGGSFFFLYGMTHAPLSLGAPLSSLAPVLALPVAIAMRMERWSILKGIGIILVIVGITALVS